MVSSTILNNIATNTNTSTFLSFMQPEKEKVVTLKDCIFSKQHFFVYVTNTLSICKLD